jgi:membrane-associated phospholipid phosphatase
MIDLVADRASNPPETDVGDLTSEQVSKDPVGASSARRILAELSRIDHAAYRAVAGTSTPTIDVPLRRLSNSANRSLIWIGVAGALAIVGGRKGRRAALAGLISIGISSATVNLGLKHLYSRERPDRSGSGVTDARHTTMPESSSFPSGHSASGFAFATAVGREIPALAFPLRMLAAAVAYSRVHSGVHYPGDAIIGSLAGGAIGQMVGGRMTPRAATAP